jgi:hypothetical protein
MGLRRGLGRVVMAAGACLGTLLSVAPGGAGASSAGPGTMVAFPQDVTDSSSQNVLTFLYTASTVGLSKGEVTLAIPKGWTIPEDTNQSGAGYVTVTAGTLTIAKSTVDVTGLSICGGCSMTITYSDATAPATGSSSVFAARAATAGEKPRALATEPSVTLSRPSSPPDAPSLDVITAGNDELVLDVREPSNSAPATSTTVTCGPDKVTVGPSEFDEFAVTGLTNGQKYKCKGLARNAAGRSPTSTPVSATPGPVVPGSVGLSSVVTGDGSFTFNYGAAAGFGSTITGYTATCGSSTTTVSGSTLTVTVSGLTVDGSYNCGLYASDSQGNGPTDDWSGLAGPPAAPDLTSVLSQDGQLTVEFRTVGDEEIGGQPMTYTATCGAQSVTVNGDTIVPALWATVSGLTDGTLYSCTVSATNTAGSGPSSTSISGTPNPVASAPTSSAGGVLLSVSCPSTAVCVAVGAGGNALSNTGLIEMSTDGGLSFTDEPVPSGTPELNGVTCYDTLHCVAVGGSTVLVSADGGANWSLESAGSFLSSVVCFSDAHCIAGGRSDAVVTSDGGMTWQESVGTAPMSAAIGCTSAFCASVGLGLFFSTDSGTTWQPFGVPGGVNGALTGVACQPLNPTCIMVGSNAQGIDNPTAPASAFMSTNNGQSWIDISSSFPSGTSEMVQADCPTDNTCYAFGFPTTSGGAQVGALTDDSGLTWASASGPTSVSPADANGLDGYALQYLSCASATTCVVVGTHASGPAAAVTTNSATTWTSSTLG